MADFNQNEFQRRKLDLFRRLDLTLAQMDILEEWFATSLYMVHSTYRAPNFVSHDLREQARFTGAAMENLARHMTQAIIKHNLFDIKIHRIQFAGHEEKEYHMRAMLGISTGDLNMPHSETEEMDLPAPGIIGEDRVLRGK